MVRANVFNSTQAKVELARRYYSNPRYTSALKAISNSEIRFAQRCCCRPVDHNEASTWAERTAILRLRMQVPTGRGVPSGANASEQKKRLAEAFCAQLDNVLRHADVRGQTGNISMLNALKVDNTPKDVTALENTPGNQGQLFHRNGVVGGQYGPARPYGLERTRSVRSDDSATWSESDSEYGYARIAGIYANTPGAYANIPGSYANIPESYANIPDSYANIPESDANNPQLHIGTEFDYLEGFSGSEYGSSIHSHDSVSLVVDPRNEHPRLGKVSSFKPNQATNRHAASSPLGSHHSGSRWSGTTAFI